MYCRFLVLAKITVLAFSVIWPSLTVAATFNYSFTDRITSDGMEPLPGSLSYLTISDGDYGVELRLTTVPTSLNGWISELSFDPSTPLPIQMSKDTLTTPGEPFFEAPSGIGSGSAFNINPWSLAYHFFSFERQIYDLETSHIAVIKIKGLDSSVRAQDFHPLGILAVGSPGAKSLYGADSMQIQAVLAPVPEPETYAMFLAGLCLLGFMARRCKTA